MVVDGQAGPKYDGISRPIFSPDGKRVGYGAQKGAKWLVVVDGQAGPEYEWIAKGGPTFHADGTLEFLAVKSGGQYRVTCFAGEARSGTETPDSAKAHVPQTLRYTDWMMLQGLECGIGFGDRANVGYGKKSPGLLFAMQILSFAHGFDKVRGLGVGTMIYEAIGAHYLVPKEGGELSRLHGGDDKEGHVWATGFPQSALPLYLYYPIVSRLRCTPADYSSAVLYCRFKYPFVYAYAGGSLWGVENSYLNCGVSVVWSAGYIAERAGPVHYTVSLKTGAFITSGFEGKTGSRIEGRIGWYLLATTAMGFVK